MSDGQFAAIATILCAAISTYGAVKASRAEKYSKPTGNGFAETVKSELKAIRAHVDDVHLDVRELRRQQADHLRDHN